jgi:hypothetical protein
MARIVDNTNQLTSPAWAGDFLNREHLVPGGARLDQAQFYAPDSVVATVGVAGAAQNATSIPVAALSEWHDAVFRHQQVRHTDGGCGGRRDLTHGGGDPNRTRER